MDSISLSWMLRNWVLSPVIEKLNKMEAQMADNQSVLDSAITQLGQVITSEDTGIVALVAEVNALIAKVQANPGADFTTEVNGINAMAADIANQAASIQATIATAKPVTGV